MCHGIESEIPNVGFLGENEATEKLSSRSHYTGLGVEVDGKVDSFEKYGVLSIVVLDVLAESKEVSHPS